MDQQQVANIVYGLANGIDPITGEILPAQSPYNHPDVIRALFQSLQWQPKQKKVKKTLAQKQQDNLDKGLPENYGLPWSDEDIKQVLEQYKGSVEIDKIAITLARKPGSIIAVLNKQGVIDDFQAQQLNQAYRYQTPR
ncbi:MULTISPECIES: hypothetical protein [Pseudoalteromonas]|uniref:Uncharacterized protein n=1 Tax=Pseudoalteromonas rubra TaxID=43658 RepID=A0A0L0ERL7_9GAMM|nr:MULTISPECIES: hypothetical protein [Pseudoalteromonas]ALU42046.1 hypothetical protein AT705_03300 [Pseudoalteromonas rubra]KNC66543.1 hypothetical protein AC626_16275 [Pseudoalteromonas rubra]MDK1310937.1 hypothetical protein [Pseudoalteromonas sp. R96]